MKKLLLAFALPCCLALASCNGGGQSSDSNEDSAVPEALKGMVALDLSSYGLPLSVMVPDSSVAIPEIMTQSWGETEIRVGKNFQLKIAEGSGDMQLKKNDIETDLMYTKFSYIVDSEKAIVYKQEVDGDALEPKFRFYAIINVGGIDYEVEDIDTENYPEKALMKMFEAAKNIQAAKPSS